jgi:sensor domain CHASE-containing protein
MGHRILVAFLAVLASLAAQIAPAQARACEQGRAEVGAVQALVRAPSLAVAQATVRGDAPGAARPVAAIVAVPDERFVAAPATRTGVDRALE